MSFNLLLFLGWLDSGHAPPTVLHIGIGLRCDTGVSGIGRGTMTMAMVSRYDIINRSSSLIFLHLSFGSLLWISKTIYTCY